MSDVPAPRKAPPQTQSSGSGHTLMTSRQPYLSDTISSKRVCFYKSGDAKFSGLPVIINNRTFRTFESLLDSLSKRVPLPFGVRTITTPRGHTTVQSLDQLENGQSYICSDRRTVKPIDLERARRKPRPWYHARPVSSRRRALQLARQKQNSGRGARNARKNERTLLHTPRRLVVFRNGDPQERHTLLLQKRTTHSFEALLDHVSQVMRFHVVKLYTPDGRRVDGLPALILCSGVLVAAGREPFKNGNYDTQRPSELTWLPAKSMGNKRFKQTVPRKKKSMSSGTKSRNFSPSSERFLINQLHRSVAGSMYDTGSVELEHGQTLESVAETETLTCPDAEGEGDGHVLPDDDIEKSFRVNQDGSMTVEMRVRLTIKEEETIHWTTTVSRSSVASQVKADCDSLSNLHEQSPDLRSLPNNGPVPLEVEHNSHAKENTDPLPLENGIVNEEKEIGGGKPNAQVVEPLSPLPTSPGFHAFREKQESIENIRRLTELEIQENVVGSYSYREETCTGEVVEEYCMLRQSSSRPVPKPRSSLPSEINNNNSSSSTHLQSSSYTSAEVLHLQDSGEEVRETVLHIYEQQSCQENFFANTQLCLQGVTTCSSRHSRPASSDTVFPASSDKTFRSTSEDWESENKISSGNELLSESSDPHVTPCTTCVSPVQVSRESVSQAQVVTVSPAAEENSRENLAVLSSEPPKRRKPVRVIIKKSRIIRNVIPERKRKEGKVHLFKDVKKGRPDILNPAKPVKPLEHLRTKAVQKWLKSKNQSVINKHRGVSVRTSAMPNNSTQVKNKNLNKLSVVREQNTSEMTSNSGDSFNFKVGEGAAPPKRDLLAAFHNKSTLTRQTSMHDDWEHEQDTKEPTEALSLGAVHSSSSVINEYVELWLQKSRPDPMCDLEEEPQSNVELRQNATFHIGSDQASSPEVSEITCEIISPEECTLPQKITAALLPSKRVLEMGLLAKKPLFENMTTEHRNPATDSSLLPNCTSSDETSIDDALLEKMPSKRHYLVETQPLSDDPSSGKSTLFKCPSLEKPPSLGDPSLEEASLSRDNSPEKTASRNDQAPMVNIVEKINAVSDPVNAVSETAQNYSIKRTPLPRKLSLKKTLPSQNPSVDQGSGEFLGQESTPDKTPLPRNMTLKRAPLPETIISKEISFANGSALEKTTLPQKQSSEKTLPSTNISSKTAQHNVNQSLESNSLPTDALSEKTLPPRTDWKQIKSPESTALAKTQLQSQPSVENIPKNNTLAKASLFNSKPLEKTPLPRKVNLVKKQTPKNVSGTTVPVSSDMSNERASASTEVVKEPCDSLQNELSEPEKMENVKQITKDTQRAEIPTEKPMCPVDEFYTVRMANELDMRPVLEQICSSIQSLRKTTHRKRRSCLEKSNSLPDFSSHVASTFGSSSRVLLAFLSVMALKDALSGLDTDWEKTSSMSCSEALRMIQSLKEVAAIEDADLLRASLNDLQKSTSSHLLQSWKGFQDLSCKARSRSVTPDSTRSEVLSGSTPDEKQAIQELMGELGVPEKVRKELAALSGAEEEQMKRNQTEHSEDITVSDPKVNVNGLIESLQREDTVSFCDSVLEEDVNIYVKSVIEKAINTHLDASDSYEKVSARDMLPTWSATEKEREVIRHEGEQSEEKEEFCHIRCLEPKQGNFTPVPDIFVDTPTSDSNLEMESMASGSIEVQHQGTKEETGKKRVEERELYEERYSEEVEDGVMDEKPSSVESFSRSKEKLSASEEEKSSLEDDEKSCDEELMSFVDDICDEDQRCSLQNAEYGDSVDQEGREIWAYSDEGQSGQTSSQTKEQLVCKSDSVEKQTSSATWQPNFIQDPVIHNAEEVNIKEQCSSMEEQSSYEEKHSSSEEGPVILEEPECYKAYQDRYEEQQKYCLEDPAKHEETTGDLAGERKSSVAQLISCLENQAKSGQSKASHATEKSSTKLFGHIDPPEVSDVDDLTNVSHISNEQVKIEEFMFGTPELKPRDSHVKSKQNNGSAEVSKQSPKIIRTTQSTPMPITSPPLPSSLAFSYDSHGTSVREPEGNVQINRVKSIREMFLAKSSTEGHYGKKKLARPNISDLSDNRPGTSESGEHQSQTSPDVSSGEDDTRKLAIAKGYVRRTIERLYGRGNSNGSDSEGKRPTSASKSKQRENPGKSKVSSLASFHEARTRVIPDLSYFKATSTFDEYEEPSQCISLNPDMNNSDTVLTDKGLCPLTETKLIDKAPPELTETAQKGVDDKKEDAPYSFFGSVSPHSTLSSTEVEDPSGPPGSKFTYFNMPNANDSELEQEDQCVDTTERKSEVKAKSPIESPRAWAEKNGSLPAFIPSELKRIDNKVHPLVEDNSSLVPVVTQPTKGQSAQTSVARHPAEPDALEMLYLMCGQHCPIL